MARNKIQQSCTTLKTDTNQQKMNCAGSICSIDSHSSSPPDGDEIMPTQNYSVRMFSAGENVRLERLFAVWILPSHPGEHFNSVQTSQVCLYCVFIVRFAGKNIKLFHRAVCGRFSNQQPVSPTNNIKQAIKNIIIWVVGRSGWLDSTSSI